MKIRHAQTVTLRNVIYQNAQFTTREFSNCDEALEHIIVGDSVLVFLHYPDKQHR